MQIGSLFKKASTFILGDEKQGLTEMEYEDNEFLFCKNNVCIHPTPRRRCVHNQLHNPGYLTVTTKTFTDQHNCSKRPTLLLTWIPNTSLCKDPCSPAFEYTKVLQVIAKEQKLQENNAGCHDGRNGTECSYTTDIQELRNELQPLLGGNMASLDELHTLMKENPITTINITISNPRIENDDIPKTSSIPKSNMLEYPGYENMITNCAEFVFRKKGNDTSDGNECQAVTSCRFSVDLSQMRSLRLFFNDGNCTSGQLVITSRESQYKILHFHYGGLDHLAQVLHQWHCFLHNITYNINFGSKRVPYRRFIVCRPEVKKTEMHPDEQNVETISTNFFYGNLLSATGQIKDEVLLRKCIFFGSLEKGLRKTVWPLLLKCYSFSSSFEDRALLVDIKRQEYEEITRRRTYSMSPEERINFWKTVQCLVEKDIARTDCSNHYYSCENNPNTEIMKNILLNYAIYNSNMSYFQGMSDLLAPILCEMQDEAESFWCFAGLIQKTSFICTPRNDDVNRNLRLLRELIRIMLPRFYKHLQSHTNAIELYFCHRWILLCFKREFTEPVVTKMWEACWSNYLTDYFHLFLCLAIISVYSDDVIAQNLQTDEMLLHFSSLAMYMDGYVILRKARGLVFQYRQLSKIPCTLSILCKRCGPGMWDSEHSPAVECVGHMDGENCSMSID